jgi:tripartite ATP-independent transporter DctP family solute receptor
LLTILSLLGGVVYNHIVEDFYLGAISMRAANYIVFLFIASLVIIPRHSSAVEAVKPKYQMIWVLAHEPSSVFERAAKSFSEEVSKATNGDVVVFVVESKKHFGRDVGARTVIKALQAGEIQLSQTYTTDLAMQSEDLWALDLPYLFRDHQHAEKVLDGKIGKDLLAGLSKHGMHGLAFTYSGGFRILPSVNKPLRRLEDFKGVKIRTSPSPVAQSTFKALGADPVVMDIDKSVAAMGRGEIDAGESTYPRYLTLGTEKVAKVLNDTEHSLFLTGVVVNKKFFDSLPASYQSAIRKAALSAAKIEREQSISDGEVAKRESVASGVKVVTLTEAEKKPLKQATQSVYAEFKQFQPIVDRIRSVR